MLSRSGIGLVEMVVALVVGGLVLTLVVGALVSQRRWWSEHQWRADRTASLRFSQLGLGREFRNSPGIQRMTVGMTRYRAGGGTGHLCVATLPSDSTLTISAEEGRSPDAAYDSIEVFTRTQGVPDGWTVLRVTSVGSGRCQSGTPGWVLGVGRTGVTGPVGTPVRYFHSAELRTYRSGGSWWIGLRRFGAGRWPAIQPVTGPVAPRGMDLLGLGSNGQPLAGTDGAAGVEYRIGFPGIGRTGGDRWFTLSTRLRGPP